MHLLQRCSCCGEVEKVWGHVPQPTLIEYDDFGQRLKLTTFREGEDFETVNWPGHTENDGDTTVWAYDEATGLLTSKTYADETAVSYAYTADGKLDTRTWARDVETDYGYDADTGELREIDYQDDTPDVTLSYTRTGRLDTVTDDAGTREFEYDDGGQITTETFTSGLFNGKVMTRQYDAQDVVGRFIGFKVGTSQVPDANYGSTYAYAAGTGRLDCVTGSGLPTGGSVYGAYYIYADDSDLLAELAFKDDGTVQAETTRTYEDNRDLITAVEHRWQPGTGNDTLISKYAYINDELARRESVVNTGEAFAADRLSLWSYNDRYELTGSDRREGDNPGSPGDPVDAEQFAYDYDPIGNRTEYDVGVQDPSDTDYEANQLNQYLRAVTDDPNVAQGYRHDDDGNLIEALVAADMNCDGAIDSFDVTPFILAMTSTPPNYPEYYAQYPNCNHLNGDLNGDGEVDAFDLDLFTALLLGSSGATGLRVEYTWNAENRLTAVTPVSPQAGDKKVEFAYDHMGRRIEKKVYDWDDQAEEWEATPSLHRKFVWGGWLWDGVELGHTVDAFCRGVARSTLRRMLGRWGAMYRPDGVQYDPACGCAFAFGRRVGTCHGSL